MRNVSLLAVLAIVVSACGNAGDPLARPDDTTPTTTTSTVPTTTAGDSTMPREHDFEPAGLLIAEQAVADLAERLDVPPGAIVIENVEEVTWSDGSLGCPEPGKAYTQALVEGVRVVLTYDGEEYHYHQGGEEDPFLCATPMAGGRFVPPTAPIDY